MSRELEASTQGGCAAGGHPAAAGRCESIQDMPETLARLYRQAAAPLRAKLLEFLLGPVGPLALVAISNGAFSHLLYRLRRDPVSICAEDAARISSGHVLELARYLEQCNPSALLQIRSLLCAVAAGTGTADALTAGAHYSLARPAAFVPTDPA